MPQYSYGTRRNAHLTSTVTSGIPRPARAVLPSRVRPAAEPEAPVTPPARQSEENLQAVLDEAHEQGILDEPADAAQAREQGVVAARIDTVDGEQVLVERVEPKKKARRKRKTKR